MAELLAPAGNWQCARAAVATGADAIYFGLPAFNARMRAENFSMEDLPELMAYIHRYGRKGYVAMNTLVFTHELEAAAEALCLIAQSGVDAIIVQDFGLARLAAELVPELAIHASTQMTITSPEGLALVHSLVPITQAVLARELSIEEIRKFQPSPVPLEVFVHGALCVAYSGQCLTSEALGQRSANRGECAQACRLPYELVVDGQVRELGEQRYLLSPQDLAAIDLVPELLQAGVQSLKIEGRLKSPQYVAAVTSAYRKALDAALQGISPALTSHDRYAMEMTFSRGLSRGWLPGTNHPALVHGRYGKKRGPLLGTIVECGPHWVRLEPDPRTLEPPLRAGDGVVFDAGQDRNDEHGAAIWKIANDGRLLFYPKHKSLDFRAIKPGQKLYKTSDPHLERELARLAKQPPLPREHAKEPLVLVVTGRPGEPLVVRTADCRIEVHSSELLQVPKQHALDAELLRAQLGRLSGTRYSLAQLECQLTRPCYLSLSALKKLRQALVVALDRCSTAARRAPLCFEQRQAVISSLMPEPSAQSASDKYAAPSALDAGQVHLAVLCRNQEQLAAALAAEVQTVYLDFEDVRRFGPTVAQARADFPQSQTRLFVATPRIFKPGERGYLKLIERTAADGVLLRNLAALDYFKRSQRFGKIVDFSLNIANPISARLLWDNLAVERLTISYDLNIAQVLELLAAAPPRWFELTLHQHMPMFHMEHCVFCTFLSQGSSWKDCGRPCEKHRVELRDRVGQLHRLHADVGCRNTLFAGRAQSGARFVGALLEAGLRHFRVELLAETQTEAFATIRAYQELLQGTRGAEELLGSLKAHAQLGITEGTLAAAGLRGAGK